MRQHWALNIAAVPSVAALASLASGLAFWIDWIALASRNIGLSLTVVAAVPSFLAFFAAGLLQLVTGMSPSWKVFVLNFVSFLAAFCLVLLVFRGSDDAGTWSTTDWGEGIPWLLAGLTGSLVASFLFNVCRARQAAA